MPKKVKAGEGEEEAPSASAKRVLDEQRVLRIGREGPVNPDSKDFCGAFQSLGMDNSWDTALFKKGFSIKVTSLSDDLVTFDLIGIDPPLANAFRRILLAEVPTVAISNVTIYQNTGVIHDENLAHRLGLVPIGLEPDRLAWKPPDSDFNETNSIAFTLQKECPQDEHQVSIYSRDLVWKPLTEEQRKLFADAPPAPVCGDILIAQLRAGQEIDLVCYCEKGIGKDHAKWSPVCTAYYRLMPEIVLTQPVGGEDARRLKEVCPKNVFDIEDVPGKGERATVVNARNCSTCRQCIEDFPGEEKGLVVGKLKNHFLFSIESVGQIRAPELFERAVRKLRDKCETAKDVLQQRADRHAEGARRA